MLIILDLAKLYEVKLGLKREFDFEDIINDTITINTKFYKS
jgi:hypothetical protein